MVELITGVKWQVSIKRKFEKNAIKILFSFHNLFGACGQSYKTFSISHSSPV
jgi:hypothetical protein